MPSINKVRVSNVVFDNNSRFYDDIVIPVNDGKLLIEAENGSGKTLLMQCILQSVKPTLYFHRRNSEYKEQPTIRNLFRSNNNTTMHSMIEWTLDEGSEYEYMLTGFCVRKINKDTEEGKVTDIEYFNYVVIYNSDAPFSLESIPLKNVKDNGVERMSYSQLNKYLNELSAREKRCLVKTFKTNNSYETFLNSYNINSSEFELMKLINQKEGGSEDYFTERYKTAYDFIVGEIVEKIESVDKMYLQDSIKSEEELAKSLFDIKSTMEKLKHKQNKVNEIDIAEKYFYKLIDVNDKLISELERKEETFKKVTKGLNSQLEIIHKANIKILEMESEKLDKISQRDIIINESESNETLLNMLEDEVEDFKKELDQIKSFKEILKRRKDKENLLTEIKKYEETLALINSRIANISNTAQTINKNILAVKRERKIKEIENIYVEYLRATKGINELEVEFELKRKGIQEILEDEKRTQENLLYVITKEVDSIKDKLNKIDYEIKMTKDQHDEISTEKQDNTIRINTNKNTLSSHQNKVKENIGLLKEKECLISQQNDTLRELESNKESIINDAKKIVDSITITEICTKEICDNVVLLESNMNKDFKEVNLQDIIEECYSKLEVATSSAKNIINSNNDKITSLEAKDLEVELQKTLKPLNDKVKQLTDNKNTYLSENDELQRSILNINATIGAEEDTLAEFYDETEGLIELLNKYLVTDRFTLENLLESETDEIKKTLFKVEDQVENTKLTIDEMERNKGVSISNEAKLCYGIISKAYSSATLGMNFIESLNINEKEKYLSGTNLIPVGIILNNTDYNSLLNNKNLLEKIDDFFVPIINIDKVKEGEKTTNEVVYISSKDKNFYINEEKRKLQIESLKKKLLTLQKEESLLQEKLNEKNNELNIVSKINHMYSNDFEISQKELIKELSKEVDDCAKEILKNENTLKEIEIDLISINDEIELHKNKTLQEIEEIKKEIQGLNKSNNNINGFREQISGIKSFLLKLENTYSKQLSIEGSMRNLKELILNLNTESEFLNTIITSLEEENSQLEENNKNLEIQLNKLDDSLKDLTLKRNNTFVDLKQHELVKNDITIIPPEIKPVMSEKSIEELKNALEAIRRNKVNQDGSIDILQRQIDSNKEIALSKKEDIDKEGVISFNELELQKNTIKKNERIIFEDIDNRLRRLEDDLKSNNDSLSLEKSNKSSNEALKEHAIVRVEAIDTQDHIEIPKDYNFEYEEKRVNEGIAKREQQKTEARNNRRILSRKFKVITEELSDLESEINTIKSDLANLVAKKEKIETIMENNKIAPNEELGLYDNGIFDVKEYERKINNHYSSINNIANIHLALRKECLGKLKDTSFSVITILEQIEAKSEIAAVIEQNIKIEMDCLTILKHTKENLSVELEQLNELKESFIEDCLRRTDNLLVKIKKLQKLVTIESDGEKRPLIKVNLNELDADNRKIRMKNHIENVLGQIDTQIDSQEISSQNDRISKALSSSKLLEQVISSPKRCEVKIYVPKNDANVISNGSYVNWGGTASGGQRNVMYFTVTIAMLLFIRELSTVGTASKQSKVLYVDGAFKASASTYLWECICPLLVDNNIQLIVTNMGTPSALMKMFDSVALLIGHQKQIGNKIIVENRIGQNSTFKSDSRTLKSENILHNFGEYRIPKKEVIKEVYDYEQITF